MDEPTGGGEARETRGPLENEVPRRVGTDNTERGAPDVDRRQESDSGNENQQRGAEEKAERRSSYNMRERWPMRWREMLEVVGGVTANAPRAAARCRGDQPPSAETGGRAG